MLKDRFTPHQWFQRNIPHAPRPTCAAMSSSSVSGAAGRHTPHSGERVLSLVEVAVLIVSAVIISALGSSAHRWLWTQAELLRYRSTMQELSTTVRAMRSRALGQRCTEQLRIDPLRGMLQLTAIRESPTAYETVERTFWLPKGLQISDAPSAVTALPTGRLSSGSILVAAPSYNRLFRLTTNEDGLVQLHEESTL